MVDVKNVRIIGERSEGIRYWGDAFRALAILGAELRRNNKTIGKSLIPVGQADTVIECLSVHGQQIATIYVDGLPTEDYLEDLLREAFEDAHFIAQANDKNLWVILDPEKLTFYDKLFKSTKLMERRFVRVDDVLVFKTPLLDADSNINVGFDAVAIDLEVHRADRADSSATVGVPGRYVLTRGQLYNKFDSLMSFPLFTNTYYHKASVGTHNCLYVYGDVKPHWSSYYGEWFSSYVNLTKLYLKEDGEGDISAVDVYGNASYQKNSYMSEVFPTFPYTPQPVSHYVNEEDMFEQSPYDWDNNYIYYKLLHSLEEGIESNVTYTLVDMKLDLNTGNLAIGAGVSKNFKGKRFTEVGEYEIGTGPDDKCWDILNYDENHIGVDGEFPDDDGQRLEVYKRQNYTPYECLSFSKRYDEATYVGYIYYDYFWGWTISGVRGFWREEIPSRKLAYLSQYEEQEITLRNTTFRKGSCVYKEPVIKEHREIGAQVADEAWHWPVDPDDFWAEYTCHKTSVPHLNPLAESMDFVIKVDLNFEYEEIPYPPREPFEVYCPGPLYGYDGSKDKYIRLSTVNDHIDGIYPPGSSPTVIHTEVAYDSEYEETLPTIFKVIDNSENKGLTIIVSPTEAQVEEAKLGASGDTFDLVSGSCAFYTLDDRTTPGEGVVQYFHQLVDSVPSNHVVYFEGVDITTNLKSAINTILNYESATVLTEDDYDFNGMTLR